MGRRPGQVFPSDSAYRSGRPSGTRVSGVSGRSGKPGTHMWPDEGMLAVLDALGEDKGARGNGSARAKESKEILS